MGVDRSHMYTNCFDKAVVAVVAVVPSDDGGGGSGGSGQWVWQWQRRRLEWWDGGVVVASVIMLVMAAMAVVRPQSGGALSPHQVMIGRDHATQIVLTAKSKVTQVPTGRANDLWSVVNARRHLPSTRLPMSVLLIGLRPSAR